jgi:hypothetical protein
MRLNPNGEDISKRRRKNIRQTGLQQERRATFLLRPLAHYGAGVTRHDHDWNTPRPRLTLEVLNELPSGVHRKRDFRRDGVGMRLPRSGISIREVIDGLCLKSKAPERVGVQFTRVGMTVHEENKWMCRWPPGATAFHRVSLHTANSPRALAKLKDATAAWAGEVIPLLGMVIADAANMTLLVMQRAVARWT